MPDAGAVDPVLSGLPPAHWVLVLVVFGMAGLVKGVVGMGLPTVAMGLLALVLRPAEAAALLIVPSLATNLWQLLAGPPFAALARRLWGMMAGIVLGTVAGAGMLAGPHAAAARTALGVVLVIYAALGLCRAAIAVRARDEHWLSPLIGLATGLVTGATGVFVVPAVPYLQALRLEREALIQALGLSFTVSTAALALGLWWAGGTAGAWPLLGPSLAALLPALAGMFAGQALRRRLSVNAFRQAFLGGLLLLGLYLAIIA